jgi:DNA-binding beta-propeller fold protein YncE
MNRTKTQMLALIATLAACSQQQTILPPSLGGPHAMAVARGVVCMDTIEGSDNVFTPGIRACKDGERGAIGLMVNDRINRVAVVDLSLRQPLILDLDTGTPGINHIPVGERPVDITVSLDGTAAVTADQLTRTLTRIDIWRLATTGEPVALPGAPLRVLTRPVTGETLALLTDNPALWIQPGVACASAGTCSGLEEAGRAVTLPATPADMMVEPDGKHAWVLYADRGWASVLRLEDTGEPCIGGSGDVCEVARVGLLHECMDGIDNDGDGLTDAEDVQCWSALGAESPAGVGRGPAGACADGIDNDGDGLTDREDPECLDGAQDDEATPQPGLIGPFVCGDGRDNDGDGKIDAADPGCYGAQGRSEVEPPVVGFERMNVDPTGTFLYVVDASNSQILVVDVARRALIDGPRSQEPRADGFNAQLGVTVGRAPTAVTGRVRRRLEPSLIAGIQGKRGIIRYDMGAYAISDNGSIYYVDTATVECQVEEPDSLLTSDEFNARGERWAASRERRCLEGLPALPLVDPAADIARCEQVVICGSCKQAGGSCAAKCDHVVADEAAVKACQLGHRAEELGDGVVRIFNPSFGLLDRFNTVDGGQLGRATCTQPDAQIAAVQQYVSANPGFRGTQDCGSVILPQPVAPSVPTSEGVRPFDLLDALRLSPLERRTLSWTQLANGTIEPLVTLSSYDERMRDDVWNVTYEGTLPATQRTDGLIDEAVDGVLLTGLDLCDAGVHEGDQLVIKTKPGTEGAGVPAGCEGFVSDADEFLTYTVAGLRPNAAELAVIPGMATAQALPTRACFPRGLSWEVRAAGEWIVSGDTSGIIADQRALGDVCVPRDGAQGGRLRHRVKTGESFSGPYFDLRLYEGLVAPVRGLSYAIRVARNFGASSLETRGLPISPQTSRATQILYEEGAAGRRFLLVLDPSDGVLYGINLSTGDTGFLLQ